MRLSEVRRKDIAAMSKAKLVETLWQIAKEADESGVTFGHGLPNDERRDLCVVTPGQVLEALEAAAWPA